jgi:selenide, water dikinase
VSSTDYFTPCVGDPYLQGQIAFCNVVSDIYVMGFEAIDNVLMILCVSTQMSKADKHRVTSQMIRGFLDKAEEAGTKITGGHSVVNPWVMIGGVAMAVVKDEEMVRNSARVGDVLLLTKPLGTQPATNVKEWLVNDKREKDDGF